MEKISREEPKLEREGTMRYEVEFKKSIGFQTVCFEASDDEDARSKLTTVAEAAKPRGEMFFFPLTLKKHIALHGPIEKK